jgi:hypothetical protein
MSFFISRMPGRLDVEAARIEADALADDGDARMLGIAPFDLDQARLAALAGGLADRPEHAIALLELGALHDGERRAIGLGEIGGGGLEIGGAHVVGAGVDPVAQLEGDAAMRSASSIFTGSPVSRTRGPWGLVVGLLVAIELVLGGEPAIERLAGLMAVDAVNALGERLGELGEAPGSEALDIGDHGDHRPVLGPVAGQDRARIGGGGELLRLRRRCGGAAAGRRARRRSPWRRSGGWCARAGRGRAEQAWRDQAWQ